MLLAICVLSLAVSIVYTVGFTGSARYSALGAFFPLLTFVCKIVRNISIKKYHAKTAIKRNSAYDVAMSEVANYILSPNNVEAEIEAKELAHIIEKFLDTLTVENRVIFMRRYWFSDTYKDIADRVGITEKMVSMRLTRIRKQMREYLMEREVLV